MNIKGLNISKEAVVNFAKGAAINAGEALAVQGVLALITKGSGAIYRKMVKHNVQKDLNNDQTVVIIKKEKENVSKKQPLTVEEFRQRFKKAEGL